MQMKRLLIICYGVLLAAFILPFFFREGQAESAAPAPDAAPRAAVYTPPASQKAERRATIRVEHDGAREDMDMTEYLTGVLAAEMPASFEMEALRAQAVAARTYAMYGESVGKHGGAEVCTSSGCCQAWMSDEEQRERWGADYEHYHARLREAVESTAGEYLSYEGAPAFAAFHSSSAGATENSAAVWSGLPYLVSVPSPESAETVPGYISTLDVSPLDFRDSLLSACPEADFSTPPEAWVGETRRDESGRVSAVILGGAEMTGAELRQLFSLRATAFELEYTGEVFRFTVTGYGHGVGMSQYGANVMAADGADYKAILLHYYPGVTLVS